MNREEIIKMAREAGMPEWLQEDWFADPFNSFALKFANLVAAAEREECAKVCGDMLAMTKYEKIPQEVRFALYEAAKAIRARGQS